MRLRNKFFTLLAGSVACLGSRFPSAQAQNNHAAYAPAEILIAMRSNAATRAVSAVANQIGPVISYHAALNTYRVSVRPGQTVQSTITALQKNPDVLFAEPNYVVSTVQSSAPTQPNDPGYAQQYAPQKTQADVAWGAWQPITPVTIAIIDTGVDSNHPDLTRKMLRDATGKVIGYNAMDKSSNALDDHYHGTHCAGIAAAEGNNGVGIAGIAGLKVSTTNYVQIMPVKVLDKNGSGYTSWAADGIVWAADHGASVISMSFGGPDASQTVRNAVQYAWQKGVIVVAAAGNDGVATTFYPAGFDNVVSVGATDAADKLASFSNYGAWVKIAAPGMSIYSTLPGNKYGLMSGTSMACPHVAGEIALLRAQFPSLSNADLSQVVLNSTDAFQPSGGHALASSAGRMNVWKAMQAINGQRMGSIQSLAFATPIITGGSAAIGTVTLTGTAPTGGLTVSLTSSAPGIAPVSSNVVIAAGRKTGTFTLTAGCPEKETVVKITAAYSTSSRDASLTVRGVHPVGLALSTATATGAGSLTGTVTLDHATSNNAPVIVALASNSGAVNVPSSVTIPAGAASASFNFKTQAVTAATNAVLTASANGAAVTANLKLNAASSGSSSDVKFLALFVGPKPLTGGRAVNIGLGLTAKAKAAMTVTMTSSSPVIFVPSSYTFTPGSEIALLSGSSSPVATATPVTVTAVCGSVTQTVTVTVLPPAVGSVALSALSVQRGQSVTGTVTLTGAAPAGGLTITPAKRKYRDIGSGAGRGSGGADRRHFHHQYAAGVPQR